MAIATLIGRMKEWLVHSKRIDAHLRRRANASIASCRLSVARRPVHQTLGMVASNRNPRAQPAQGSWFYPSVGTRDTGERPPLARERNLLYDRRSPQDGIRKHLTNIGKMPSRW